MSGKAAHITTTQLVHQAWQGPVPPPATLRAFKELVPDAPERILAMAEEEARTRREIMMRDSESTNRRKEAEIAAYHQDIRRGQVIAFLYLIAVLAVVIVCAYLKCEKIGITVAGMGAAGIVANFIWRKK